MVDVHDSQYEAVIRNGTAAQEEFEALGDRVDASKSAVLVGGAYRSLGEVEQEIKKLREGLLLSRLFRSQPLAFFKNRRHVLLLTRHKLFTGWG